MGARCGSLEPASCQVACENRSCCSNPSASSSAAPVPAPLVASHDARTGSKGSYASDGSVVVEQESVFRIQQRSPSTPQPSPSSASFAAREDLQAATPLHSPTGKKQASFEGKSQGGPVLSPHAETETENDVQESPASKLSSKEKKVATLKSAIAKVKGAALGTVGELKTFRKFLKLKFSTPGEAFDQFVGPYSTQLDKRTFLTRLEELQYVGNSERLFQALSGGGVDIVEREVFKQRLVAIGRVELPKKKGISFGEVVLQPVQQLKRADIKNMLNGKIEEGWDPPPAAIVTVDTAPEAMRRELPKGVQLVYVPPTLLDLMREGKTPPPTPTSTITSMSTLNATSMYPWESTAASGQPSASGQPPRQRNSTEETDQDAARPASPVSPGRAAKEATSPKRAKAKEATSPKRLSLKSGKAPEAKEATSPKRRHSDGSINVKEFKEGSPRGPRSRRSSSGSQRDSGTDVLSLLKAQPEACTASQLATPGDADADAEVD